MERLKNCKCSVYIHWKEINLVCEKIWQETEQTSWYWAAQQFEYIQQINGGSWQHGPEYCSIHNQLTIKEVVVATY